MVKNPDSMQTVILKKADNHKILCLKISGKHLAALQKISRQEYKIMIYNLEKEKI